MMPIPSGYDKVLTKQNGVYMKPSKVPALHDDIIWEVNRPCNVVLEELLGS